MLTRLIRQRRGEEGFTLIELLVVVAIIALLTAFAVPSLYQAMNKSKIGKDKVALDTISGAIERYYVDTTSYPLAKGVDGSDANTTLEPEERYAPAVTFEKFLKENYIKQSATKLYNSFGYSYIYITNGGGEFFILVDPTNKSVNAPISIRCGGNVDVATGEVTGGVDLVKDSTDSGAADIKVTKPNTDLTYPRMVWTVTTTLDDPETASTGKKFRTGCVAYDTVGGKMMVNKDVAVFTSF